VLQSAVNVGILVASVAAFLMAGADARLVFLVGVLPAWLVFWIRREVPEPAEWAEAAASAGPRPPSIADLFRPGLRRTSILVILICSASLTAHWAFMFWSQLHLYNLPDVAAWSEGERRRLVSLAMLLVMLASIAGNFVAAYLARLLGDRRTIALLSTGYFAAMIATYGVPRGHSSLMVLLPVISVFSGLFALFTMYLPPLFPTLLRTTGAGFCYNIGRIASAIGTVAFGCLFLPAGLLALGLPDLNDRDER
jgi:hypothetical protein